MRRIQLPREGSFKSRIKRAIGETSGFELPLPSSEKREASVTVYYPHYDFHRELRNATLEAEKHKAKSIMEQARLAR